MFILLKLFTVFLNIIYLFFKLLPTKNKITFISRQGNNPSKDFLLLNDHLKKDYDIVMLTKKLEPGLSNRVKYMFHMLSQMYHIATSKVVILDSYCILASVLKHKKRLVIIQMWHAMGSLKKFGFSVIETDTSNSSLGKKMSSNKKRKLADVMKMHKGYDYIFTSCEASVPNFAEAFGYNVDNLVIMPQPIVDILNDKKYIKDRSIKIKNEYPIMKNKINIIYVPTFRTQEKEEKIQELIDSIDYGKYNLIIKLHPLTKITSYDKRVIWDKKYTSRDMMMASDIIITDYSAIVFEAALLNKPIYFYTYDYDDYVDTRSFYVDFKKELPGKMSGDAKKIIKYIDKNMYDEVLIKNFSKKWIYQTNEKVCLRIEKFIKDAVLKKEKF